MKNAMIIVAWTAPFAFLGGWVVLGMIHEDNGSTKSGLAKSDLQVLEQAVRKLAWEEKFTATDWDQLNDMKTVGPRIAVYLEQGMDALIDPWGDQYVLEKRDEGDRIVITIRCNHMQRRKWWQEDKVIGIELVVSRADGAIVGRKDLWR